MSTRKHAGEDCGLDMGLVLFVLLVVKQPKFPTRLSKLSSDLILFQEGSMPQSCSQYDLCQ